MSNEWTVEAIEKKRWLAQQHRGREGELAALDKIEELLELQGELVASIEELLGSSEFMRAEYSDMNKAVWQAEELLAKAKGETNG